MTQSIYDSYLLYIKNNSGRFGIIGFQTDNILFIANRTFTIKKEELLY